MQAKLRIKIGEFELEFEGSESFIKDDLQKMINDMSKVTLDLPAHNQKIETEQFSTKLTTTAAVASKLSVKSGSDLVIAACTKLQIVDRADTCSRKKILSEMRSAKAFFKVSYSNNLTKTLSAMTKSGALLPTGGENYSLPDEKLETLRKAIA